ncbi:MAG: phosphoribosyltransferase [Thermoguttaceae bacterium]
MQLHPGTLPDGTPFLSHDALPFLPDADLRGQRVLLFDDSVIYGSTMARTKQYLERRGAMVSCASYSVDKASFYGERPDDSESGTPSPHAWVPLHVKHRLWPSAVRLHHAALVRAVLSTHLHYNLDFPTFLFRVPKFDPRDVPHIVHLLAHIPLIRRIADVSTPTSIAFGVPRFSALLDHHNWNALSSPNVKFRQYGKVRFKVLPQAGEIRLTPVLQLALSKASDGQPVAFDNSEVLGLWHQLLPPADPADPFYSPALFRLVTAFAGIVFGAELCQRFSDVLSDALSSCELSLVLDDTRLVLGADNASRLAHVFSSVRDGHLGMLKHEACTLTQEGREVPNAPALRDKVAQVFLNRPVFCPCDEELLCESVGKVFLALRQATDSPECRQVNPSAGRSDTGLTYEGVRSVLELAGRHGVSDDDLSFTIDMCVDRGLVVPKVIKENDTWFRAFYSGEGEDDQDPLQFKNAFHRGYGAYLKRKGSSPLSPFDVQKLCVCLKDVMPWLPISTCPYKYGFTTTVGQEQLIRWLTHGPAAPCRLRQDGRRHLVIVNSDYVSPTTPVWENALREKEFFDSFDYAATAFAKMKDSEKLLLTTCRTHRHTFNAIAFEAHAWASYEEHGFGAMLLGIEQNCCHGNANSDFVALSLYWCIRYVSEALKKYVIFHRQYKTLLAGVKRAFSTQGDPAKRWWAFLQRQNLFDPKPDAEIQHGFSLLMPLVDQMRSLTIFVAGALDESGLLPAKRLEAEFKAHSVSLDFEEFGWFTKTDWLAAARAYNHNIDEGKVPGRSILTTQLVTTLPSGTADQAWGKETTEVARRAFDELSKSLHTYCKKYAVQEQDFPFAPDAVHRVLDDGSTEERRDNVFLLTLDIIKGTNAEQTNRMKDEIRGVFASFQGKGLVFEDTGNDAFVAVCDDPLTLWDAASALRVRGETLILPGQPFGGTRKGLYFGSVAIIRSASDKILIRDTRIPNTVPAACYILVGIDQQVEAGLRNKVLIVEAGETLEKCAGRLGLNMDSLPRVSVKGKHFNGSCAILNLQ